MARNLTCSFCGRDEHQVPSLVAGPNVHICGDCVALAQRAIDEHPPPGTAAAQPETREGGIRRAIARLRRVAGLPRLAAQLQR